jgi:hypothetical protein
MKPVLVALSGALLASVALTQSACATHQPHPQSINARQYDQRERIIQGVRSGELTREEAQTLRAEQRAIQREEHYYRADGVLTPRERRELQRELNEASQNIYEEKHDAEVR